MPLLKIKEITPRCLEPLENDNLKGLEVCSKNANEKIGKTGNILIENSESFREMKEYFLRRRSAIHLGKRYVRAAVNSALNLLT